MLAVTNVRAVGGRQLRRRHAWNEQREISVLAPRRQVRDSLVAFRRDQEEIFARKAAQSEAAFVNPPRCGLVAAELLINTVL